MGRFIFAAFVALALYLSELFSPQNNTTVLIAFLTFFWHSIVHLFCLFISQYRFKNPAAKYVKIKNKLISKMFVVPVEFDDVALASDSDTKMNIIGFVLNITNVLLFICFEILLFMPKISCDLYEYRLIVLDSPHGADRYGVLLNSLNEIIPAEVSRIFAIAVVIIFFVFMKLFDRQLKEHRQKIAKNTAKNPKTPCQKRFKKTEWHYPLCTSLIDGSVRQNRKKHKFWYNTDQLEQIENLVKSASENAELKLETKEKKIVSFIVVDTLNKHVVFTGLFI